MTESSKIEFAARHIREIGDITDLAHVFFHSNRNQQHAAGRILLALKAATQPIPSLSYLEDRYGISRRTLQRTRAKLSRLGLIERISWMNSRYGGQEGWRLSSRMSTALRLLADKIDDWRKDNSPERRRKEETLTVLLAATSKDTPSYAGAPQPIDKSGHSS